MLLAACWPPKRMAGAQAVRCLSWGQCRRQRGTAIWTASVNRFRNGLPSELKRTPNSAVDMLPSMKPFPRISPLGRQGGYITVASAFAVLNGLLMLMSAQIGYLFYRSEERRVGKSV